MRILIADAFPDASLTEIAERGHDCARAPEVSAEQLPDHLAGCDILVVRSTKVTRAALEAADSLRVVIRAGSGTNTIDRDAATELGIAVCNVPGRNAVAVAELTFALLLALDRNIPDNVLDLREGHWNKQRYAHARGVHGRTVGIVGLGQIGLEVAQRAAAFGTDVYALAKPDRDQHTLQRAHAIGIGFVDTLETLARTCDVLSFHVPATDSTRSLIGRKLLEHVQPGAILLNTSRGELVDDDALIEAMDTKGVRAGLDVFTGEPGSSTGEIASRLATHPNVYGTHHIGASTEQAQSAVADEVVRMLGELERGNAPHCVNFESPRVDVDTSEAPLDTSRQTMADSLQLGGVP